MKHQLTGRAKIAALILPAILTAGLMQAQAPAAAVAPQTFIATVAPMAQASQRTYNVPASVSIAQAILESGWGESGLTKRANNYFGIKCSQWRSQYQTGCISMNTWEVYSGANVYTNAAFRTYASGEDSFKDHGNFFHVNSRYAPAFSTTTADDFARAIHRAGYATDPNYANKLIGLMNDYGLRKYDNISAPAKPAAPKYEIRGGINTTYQNLNNDVRSRLGSPTANEQTIKGGWKQTFSGGTIYYSLKAGGYVVWGGIASGYKSNGGSDVLGLPTGNEYKVGNGFAQPFANGTLMGNDTLGYWLIPTELLPTYQANSTVLGLPVAEAMTTETQISQNYENGTLAITR